MDSRLPPDPIFVLRGSESAVNTLCFSPTGISEHGVLVSGSGKGIISIWNLKTKRVQTSLDEHTGKGILNLDITKEGKLISHGRDGFMNVYDIADGSPTLETKLPLPVFGFCKFSLLQHDDKTLLATASSAQSQIDIVDLDAKSVICKIKSDDEKKFGMCMCVKLYVCPKTQQTKLLAGYEDGCIRLFDIGSGKIESSVKVHSESVMCLNVDVSLQKVVTGSADNKLVVSEITPVNTLKIIHEVELKKAGIADVKIRNDGKIVCTGGWDGRIRLFSWKSLKPLAILNCHSSTVSTIDYSPTLPDSGVLMAAGSKDCKISIWSIY